MWKIDASQSVLWQRWGFGPPGSPCRGRSQTTASCLPAPTRPIGGLPAPARHSRQPGWLTRSGSLRTRRYRLVSAPVRGDPTGEERHLPFGPRRPRRSRVYRAVVLDENAVNTLIGVYAVSVDRRGVAAWPS